MKQTLYFVHYDHMAVDAAPVISDIKPREVGEAYSGMLLGEFEVEIPEITKEEVIKARKLADAKRYAAKVRYHETQIRDLESNIAGGVH